MNPERKKILYQSWHRGCKETDVVLGPFAEQFLPICGEGELKAFIALLDEDDWDIWHWFTTHPTHTPEKHKSMIDMILAAQLLAVTN